MGDDATRFRRARFGILAPHTGERLAPSTSAITATTVMAAGSILVLTATAAAAGPGTGEHPAVQTQRQLSVLPASLDTAPSEATLAQADVDAAIAEANRIAAEAAQAEAAQAAADEAARKAKAAETEAPVTRPRPPVTPPRPAPVPPRPAPVPPRPAQTATPAPTHPATGSGAVMAAWARRQVGLPYVWGASGPSSFDCSGLVLVAARQVGVSLAHYTGDQYHDGQSIAWSDLEPGDLLFFYADISHVGIYVGGGQMVHASNSRTGVLLSDLAGYYQSNFVGARRVA